MISSHKIENYQSRVVKKVRGSNKTNTSKKVPYQYFKPIIKL